MRKSSRAAWKRESSLSMRSTVFRRRWRRLCCSFYSARCLVTRVCRKAGSLWQQATHRNIISLCGNLMWWHWTGSSGLMWKPILTSGRNMLIRWESIRRYFLIWNFEKRISTVWKIQWMGKCLSQPEAGRIYQGCSRSMRSLVKRWTVRLCISISSIGKRRRILQIIWSCIRSIRRSMDWSGSLPDIMKQIRWNAWNLLHSMNGLAW